MTTVPENVQQAYGPLPDGWRLEKLKFFADVRNSNVDKTVADDEEPVRLCNYTDVYYNDRITSDLEFMNGSATEAEIEKFQLKRGQVIITKDSEGWNDIGIPALVIEDMPDVLCGYHLSVLEPRNELDGGFLAWLCRSEPLNDQFKLGANGVTRYGLGQYPMKNAFVALPPFETQQRIARFLDEKTAWIGALIEKKRALLDRLAEKRRALITRAVTKGLNPDAAMKPSGIEWLGDIPAHWEAANLRWLTHQIKTGPFGAQLSSAEFVDDEIPVINPSDILDGKISANRHNTVTAETAERLVAYRMKPNDIVFARRGEMGRCALVREAQDGWLCGTGCIVVTPDVNILHSRFTEFFLGSQFSQEWFSLNSVGATMANLNEEILGLFPITVPPVYEQIAICEYLDRSLKYEDDRTTKVQRSVKLLEDYRAALITAAVTGKISELQWR